MVEKVLTFQQFLVIPKTVTTGTVCANAQNAGRTTYLMEVIQMEYT